ncbi:2OG-Fe(II) oxygenase family protein [Erythrobacter sp.]|uniref:2OG-Fe(II) oxygenase n=1 Tax=Erythrobacter sp. TaxID=1042 RepID=UPI001B0D323F|nr:2OG-Fe(II) oxygenase family protein [Erythrobacter sp.]MBO6527790.1 2OG-Fe(II) oxygenase [Erythrobacter sp.]MBO6531260.1 2OG-Fe(II) oxygenase [Erythrobacter sp.]
MNFQLNPDIDVGAASAAYAVRQRYQVKDILTQDSATTIHERLASLDWWLTYNEGSEVHQLHPTHLRQMQPNEAAQIQQTVFRNAQTQYQFLYNYYPLLAAYFSPAIDSMPLFPVFEFLNSSAFLEFARLLTGLDDIRWADGQATLFRATHFLKYHTDRQDTEQRRAAYVLNFTTQWDTDWGGLLQFWDGEGNIELALKPTFNALNVFTVPQPHSVSSVASYAPGLRFSITGWLRADEPPGPIGKR